MVHFLLVNWPCVVVSRCVTLCHVVPCSHNCDILSGDLGICAYQRDTTETAKGPTSPTCRHRQGLSLNLQKSSHVFDLLGKPQGPLLSPEKPQLWRCMAKTCHCFVLFSSKLQSGPLRGWNRARHKEQLAQFKQSEGDKITMKKFLAFLTNREMEEVQILFAAAQHLMRR